MRTIYVSLVVLLCVVIEIQSEKIRICDGCRSSEGYTRIKRAKYYSSPPQRFFRRPPVNYPIRGAFSYTPPPGYMMDDEDQLPPNSKPRQVSKRPTNEGLGDEDIYNIMKYLSKQDLDKIIEFAGEKDREVSKYNKESFYDKPNNIASRPDVKKSESKNLYKDNAPEFDNAKKFSLNGPYVGAQESFRPYSIDYNNPNENDFQESQTSRFVERGPVKTFNNYAAQFNAPSENEESSQQFSFINAYRNQDINRITTNKTGGNIFTDSSIMQEEQLPKPSNLREDYDVSYTNNVPTVVKADSDTYKVENFGELPLMNYNAKLDTVDSYKVPHYTVVSPSKYGAPAAEVNIPSVEPAPPGAGQDQSDAHLKAVKIWTHKSKGTAYTLHNDGSLSLERPSRPSTKYGYP